MGNTIQSYLTSWKGHTFQNITSDLLVDKAIHKIPVPVVVGFMNALVGQSKYNLKLGTTLRLSTLAAGIVMLLFLILLSPIVGSMPMVVLAIVLMRIAMNTFDCQTLMYVVERRWAKFSIMLITFLLIVIAHHLALGVLVGTAVYYSYQRIQKY